MSKLFLLILGVALLGGLTACNTISGVGEDVSGLGSDISRGAQAVGDNM